MHEYVLIVEDDNDIREDLAEILRDEGHQVETAANGADALAQLEHKAQRGERPCLILLDLMMPVMNGWDFRAKQMSTPGIADIPVILVSGALDVPHHATTLHTAGYLRKPIQLPRLLELVTQTC